MRSSSLARVVVACGIILLIPAVSNLSAQLLPFPQELTQELFEDHSQDLSLGISLDLSPQKASRKNHTLCIGL